MKYCHLNYFFYHFTFICAVIFALSSCDNSSEEGNIGPIFASQNCIRFTNAPLTERPETIQCEAEEQTITLRVVSMTDPEMPLPTALSLSFAEWDYDKNDWNMASLPTDVNQPDDFYHAWTESENGTPVLKISLSENNTGEDRKILIHATSKELYHHNLLYGEIIIHQLPYQSKKFSLKAKYKDCIYTTDAEINYEGDFIFFNQEYANLMRTIDNDPSIQIVLLDNNTIYYYDNQDIKENKPYLDAIAVKEEEEKQCPSDTRATGFEAFDSSYLGYVALYEHADFSGTKLDKGLTNFEFTWNLPNLKHYEMNDKISSIAVAFNDLSPLVCTVLTIWDDADYNFGDRNRKKHRISIIASKFNPRVTCENLKKIKKIGSSKSWNDCMSSISLHFGYLDSLLLDY